MPILFTAVFLEAIGLPVPAALVLVIAGGAAANGSLQVDYALSGAIVVTLAGDTLMFLLVATPAGGCWVCSAAYR